MKRLRAALVIAAIVLVAILIWTRLSDDAPTERAEPAQPAQPAQPIAPAEDPRPPETPPEEVAVAVEQPPAQQAVAIARPAPVAKKITEPPADKQPEPEKAEQPEPEKAQEPEPEKAEEPKAEPQPAPAPKEEPAAAPPQAPIELRYTEDVAWVKTAAIVLTIDGTRIVNKAAKQGLDTQRGFELYTGQLTAGRHKVELDIKMIGDGGVFSYLEGYAFTVRHKAVITVVPDKNTRVHISATERGGITDEWKDRVAIRAEVTTAAAGDRQAM